MNKEIKRKPLGISIYPEIQNEKEIINYIKLASSYGFSRIFTSLLQITDVNKKEMIQKMKKIINYAKSLNYEIVVDVSPRVFNILNIKLPDLSFFNNLGCSTIRMDVHENGFIEKEIANNPYGIKLEINMSSFKNLSTFLNDFKINKNNLIASHNFYPQRYTGLDYQYFLDITKHYKKLGFKTSAFITSQNAKTGPWVINEGLPTLEIHRDLPITTQAKHLFALNMIDDVVIGNAFASKEELKALSNLNFNKLVLDVKVTKNKMTEIEKKIVFDYDKHFRRGDINSYIIRSTLTRVIYKEENIKKDNVTKLQKPGEIYVCNDEFKNYKGEMHLILKEMPGDKRKNKIGEIVEHEKFLINYINSWDDFNLKIKD